MDPTNIIDLNNANFTEITSAGDKLVLVDFWAPWCMPCRAIAPVLAKLAAEYPDNLIIGKLNVDDNQQIAYKYGISSIPNVKVFKNGKAVEELVGSRPYASYKSVVDKYIAT